MGTVYLDARTKTIPEGGYKQAIWERVIWLDDNGKLKSKKTLFMEVFYLFTSLF